MNLTCREFYQSCIKSCSYIGLYQKGRGVTYKMGDVTWISERKGRKQRTSWLGVWGGGVGAIWEREEKVGATALMWEKCGEECKKVSRVLSGIAPGVPSTDVSKDSIVLPAHERSVGCQNGTWRSQFYQVTLSYHKWLQLVFELLVLLLSTTTIVRLFP